MKTRIHYAGCPQEYLTAYGLDPAKVIYFDIETTGFRASTSRLYMIGWAVQKDTFCASLADDAACTALPDDPARGSLSDDPARASLSDDPARASLAEDHSPSAFCQDWVVTQIMAESSAEEILLLEQFGRILGLYDTILEFNGDRFDLPYMKEKYESYQMADPFSHCKTVDLYRVIKPYKNMLGMSRLNQKSVEQYLHITREDPYNGGELIDVYRSVRSHSCEDEEGAISALFLHNFEDVLGMLAMTPLLAYPLAMLSTAPVTICPKEARPQNLGSGMIEASFTLDAAIPHPLSLVVGREIEENLLSGQLPGAADEDTISSQRTVPKAACHIEIEGKQVKVTLYLLPLSLYHYFPDYRNYYYLPEEDTAIHKSVASFVDPSHREKAKAQNCYVKKQGTFLPQTAEHYQPSFSRCYKDSVSWFEYQPGIEEDQETFSAYIHALIRAGEPMK